MKTIIYNSKERLFLYILAITSFFILNTAFIYTLFFDPEALLNALKNPISAAFIFEAFILMSTFAYFLKKWNLTKLHWRWFVLFSLVGSMGFAIPIVLLWPFNNKK